MFQYANKVVILNMLLFVYISVICISPLQAPNYEVGA